ncbi:hypothetical protein OQJ18_13565 [Fluoribacter dumoffii]|uniref:hypothetical protein n=1 Tax=Fluoribacter dumoffii TaxID=463 RepID=UPI0022442DB4|nr:hypothetical protein [Fluoribacter dumoffii]MCW8387579.1 hypothetical protein [Fluoribacter dumoffii]MCW8416876.1 hypothetical protein [Fluoribacter dumoffii]MCW8455284.1 hypothetical protein [Fluoribacter dumoffii]MCW8460638.1 hypothetical protein [Fluoribacter dumoffii]MCW8484119.1 hypothetical protein [Fluoribacter dumoffii]
MSFEKLPLAFGDRSLSAIDTYDDEIINLVNILNGHDFGSPPIGYTFEVHISPELVSTLAPREKRELFEVLFNLMKEDIKSVQNGKTPLNITELTTLKDLINDNPMDTKKLFFYFTDKSRIDYIVTEENLPTLRELFPGNASLQKNSLAEIKESLLLNQQLYSKASVRGLFAHKNELPYELAEQIGSYLDIKSASMVAQTGSNAARQATEVLDAVDDDNTLLKRFI